MLSGRVIKLTSFVLILSVLLSVFLCGCGGIEETAESKGKIVPFSVDLPQTSSNRRTSVEPEPTEAYGLSSDGFEPVLENERYVCYYRESVCAIRLMDKSNGYIWGSLNEDNPENLNKKWSCYGNSAVAIEYADAKNSVSVTGADKNALKYTVKNGGISFKADFKEQRISFNFDLTLTNDGFKIALDEKSVKEETDKRLVSVTFLPYFGSVCEAEKQGYIFVPDGCGALIRFNASRNYLEGFSKRIFGADYGIESMLSVNGIGSDRIESFETKEQNASVPVFGVSHGTKQNAFYAIVENGAEYCKINADPAGVVTDYNRVNASFIYRSMYEQPVNRKSAGIKSVQKDKNDVSPVISYHFLSGEDAGYVGMAKGYRDYLEDKKAAPDFCVDKGDIPLRLDVLVSDVQKEFIGSSVNKITECKEIEKLLSKLEKSGTEKINLALLGWQSKGLNGYKLLENSRCIYDDSSMKSLSDMLGKNGNLLLFVSAFKGSKLQFDIKTKSCITLSQNIAKLTADDDSFYLADEYLLKPDAALDRLYKNIDETKYSLAIGDIGNMLYGEYLEDGVTNRKKVLENIINIFEKNKKTGFTLVAPNSYLYKYTENYYDIPITNSQYVFETDCVPFLQIVLSGGTQMYSPYLNCSLYSKADLLKLIDYNTYPSFILTGKNNYELRNTPSSLIQSSRMEDWEDYIKDSYESINGVLANTYGKQIMNRTVLSNGFVRVDYQDGSVYVNYNNHDVDSHGVSVKAQTAIFVSGGLLK